MRASAAGIEINKAELGALLLVAGRNDGAVVKFRIDGKQKLVASASDGRRAIECQAPGGDAERGEWTVPALWLEQLRLGAKKGTTDVLLRPTSKGMKDAVLRGEASRSEFLEIIDKTNGTSTQVSMESLHELAKEKRLEGSWFAVLPKQVNRIFDVVSKAADGCPISIFPPVDDKGQVLFACSSAGGRWQGVLQPALVEGPGGEAEEEDDDEDAPGRPPKQPALPGTDDADDADEDSEEEEAEEGDDSGVVDDDYAEKLKTQKPPKKKAAKKTAKKTAKKKAKKK